MFRFYRMSYTVYVQILQGALHSLYSNSTRCLTQFKLQLYRVPYTVHVKILQGALHNTSLNSTVNKTCFHRRFRGQATVHYPPPLHGVKSCCVVPCTPHYFSLVLSTNLLRTDSTLNTLNNRKHSALMIKCMCS